MNYEKFDLVLLDVSLADGNGFAVCSSIKQNYDIPVIFLKSYLGSVAKDYG